MLIFLAVLIILYSLYIIIDTKDAIIRYYSDYETLHFFDVFAIILIIVWTIVQFFLMTGPIVLIPIVLGLFNLKRKSMKRARLLLRLFYTLVIITTSFVVLNIMYFNLNFWK